MHAHTCMCPLQIINDNEPLSSTLRSINAHFIHRLSDVKTYFIGHKSETGQPKQKRYSKLNIFTTVYKCLAQNLKNKWLKIFV